MTNDDMLNRLAEIALMAPVRDEQEINALTLAIQDNLRRAEADRDSQQRTAVKAMEERDAMAAHVERLRAWSETYSACTARPKTIMRDHKLLVLIAGTALSVIIAIANF